MKILHVIPSMSPRRGGPGILLRSLAEASAQAGHEVHVATTDDDGAGRLRPAPPIPQREGRVQYWRFPRQVRFYTVSGPLFVWLGRRVAEFDVVHVHAIFTFPALAAAFWAARRGVPYVVRPLGTLNRWGVRNRRPWLKRVSFPLIERRILENAARVHYTSRREWEEASELGFRATAAVVPNAFDPAQVEGGLAERFLNRHPELAGRKWVLFLSRLDAKKGLDLLLEAFSNLRGLDPPPALVLAGDGPPDFTASLERLAARLGISERVLFAGFLQGEEKRDALAAADVFSLPSYSENFGIAAVEAMAVGLPVVISDQVAIHPEVAAAEAGWVVPCQSAELAEALRTALLEGRASPKGVRARELARRRFSIESVVGQLVRLYEQVVRVDGVDGVDDVNGVDP